LRGEPGQPDVLLPLRLFAHPDGEVRLVSEAVTATAAVAPAAAGSGAGALRRGRQAGDVLLGLQLPGFLPRSAAPCPPYPLTWDYATYNQPWFLVAHGHLNPYSTVSRLPFWQNDGEFMPWVLAPLYWVARSDLVLPWAQDASIAGAELVAFVWLCDLAKRHC